MTHHRTDTDRDSTDHTDHHADHHADCLDRCGEDNAMAHTDDNNHTDDTTHPGEAGRELATVHHLPGPDPDMVEGEVLEGEVITTEEYRRIQREKALARYQGYRNDVVTLARVTRTLATHDRTKTAGKAVVRHALYVPAGLGVVLKRLWEAKTNSRYERLMRAAEAAGDREALLEWETRAVTERQRRHDRAMDWVAAPWRIAKTLVALTVTLFGTLLGLGIMLAINDGDISRVLDPINGFLGMVEWIVWAVTIAWGPLVLITPWLAGLWLWNEGRKRAAVPTWLTPTTSADGGDVMDGLPDENTIINALRNLNIRGFNQALKDGWRVRFRELPHVDGKGWRAQLDLPPACPVEEIVRRKSMLAHNLVRYPIEVWPTEPQPSVLDLWVAKPGALSGPVEPWPLLAELDRARVDYFAGVPAGVTIKGDVVRGRLSEANYVVGGMMGSGKSSLVITLILGAMLDPLVDIDVVVMAENADYEPMAPRLRTLVTGAGDDTVETCLTMLHQLYEELAVRGKALREHDARAVSRELAEKDARLRPRVMVIDECQNLFLGEHGKPAIEVASKLMSTARKYAITLMFLTPEPSKDALPRKLITIASNKACFAIGDQQGNDAVLGTGSYKAGISAVGLSPKTDEGPGDVGTCMQRGFTATPGLLRSFFIPQDDAHRVAHRAMQLREQHGIDGQPAVERAVRDPLADIAQVTTGHTLMRTQDVLQRLTEMDRPAYGGWTFTDLRNALPDSAKPYKTRGVFQVSHARVREAIAERDEFGEGVD